MNHDHCLGPEIHLVEYLRLYRQILHALATQSLVGRTHHDVLRGMKRKPDAQLIRPPSEFRQLRATLSDLPMELRQIWMRCIWSQIRGHPVHPEVRLLQIRENRMEIVNRHPKMRVRLPAA